MLYRVSRGSRMSKWYAVEFSRWENETDNIEELVEGGDVVILTDDLDSIADITGDNLEIVG